MGLWVVRGRDGCKDHRSRGLENNANFGWLPLTAVAIRVRYPNTHEQKKIRINRERGRIEEGEKRESIGAGRSTRYTNIWAECLTANKE